MVDDGSTDESGQICDEYQKKDARIRVLHKQNGGLSSARNAGIQIARGEYLTFIDSDDYITTDMIEQLYLTIHGCDISVCSLTSEENELSIALNAKKEIYTAYQALKKIFSERGITTSASAKLFKKELFNGIVFPEGMIYEDYATIYKVMDRAKSISVAKTKKYYYRINPTSITKSTFNKKRMQYFNVSNEVKAFVENKYPRLKKYVRRRSVRYAISFLREISACGFEDEEIIARLVKLVRRSIIDYLFSGYALLSKLYGLYIAVCPKKALKVFKEK